MCLQNCDGCFVNAPVMDVNIAFFMKTMPSCHMSQTISSL
jgi:hypothetical protein